MPHSMPPAKSVFYTVSYWLNNSYPHITMSAKSSTSHRTSYVTSSQLVGQVTWASPRLSPSPSSSTLLNRYPMFINITSSGSAFILFWLAWAASSELSTSRSFFDPSCCTENHSCAHSVCKLAHEYPIRW